MLRFPLETSGMQLKEIIEQLHPGEEITLTKCDRPIATLRLLPESQGEPPRFGTLRGSIVYLADDFDAIPDGFEDYLP